MLNGVGYIVVGWTKDVKSLRTATVDGFKDAGGVDMLESRKGRSELSTRLWATLNSSYVHAMHMFYADFLGGIVARSKRAKRVHPD